VQLGGGGVTTIDAYVISSRLHLLKQSFCSIVIFDVLCVSLKQDMSKMTQAVLGINRGQVGP
jgi:hypothetical protein